MRDHHHSEPGRTPPSDLTLTRRQLLVWGGLSGAMALFAGCSRAADELAIPFLEQPEENAAGLARWYATTCRGCAAGCRVVAKVRDGRPIKLEGLPTPLNRHGGLCAVGQAQVRGLYDADRLRGPRVDGAVTTWDALDRHVSTTLARLRDAGKPVVVLTGAVTGPAMRGAIASLVARYPNVRHVDAEPDAPVAMREAWRRGTTHHAVVPDVPLDRARLILGVDADFLGGWLAPVAFASRYADARRPERPGGPARHVQIESRHSITGGCADQRVVVAPSQTRAVLASLVARVAAALHRRLPWSAPPACSVPDDTLATLAQRLLDARGAAVVLCGVDDVVTQQLAAALNALLDAPLDFARPLTTASTTTHAATDALLADAAAGRLGGLIVCGPNPVFAHPRGAELAAAIGKLELSVALATHDDETVGACRVVAPAAHFLESWGDGQPRADLFTLQQPTVRPLVDCRAWPESLLRFAGDATPLPKQLKDHWRQFAPAGGDAESFWLGALRDGGIERPVADAAPVAFDFATLPPAAECAEASSNAVEFVVYSGSLSGDGRHASNPWLQECPDPVTSLTWDNAALLHPATADALGVADGQLLAITHGSTTITLPALRVPGLHRRVVAVARGYGRTRAGRFGAGVGVNVAPLDTGHSLPVTLAAQSGTRPLARLQDAHRTTSPFTGGHRPIMPEASAAAFAANAAAGRLPGHESPQPFAAHEYSGRKWAMVVDLSRCIGCGGCILACQAENNIPVVGRDEVALHREMHWLRLDRYFVGDDDAARTQHMPLMCQHCDNAPCEAVCPVLATTHSAEGINEQTYNRCVGTRYCANNCPYKARRFNWFAYPRESELENQVLNPDVTVRSRGVMEKCTFCIQRISAAKATARREGRELADGEALPACAQGCPTRAIVFGDGNDAASAVSAAAASPRAGRLLESINTRPAVQYLTRIRHDDTGETHAEAHHD